MADILTFRKGQEAIYRERFRQMEPLIRKDGFKSDTVFANRRGGLLVAFLPDKYTAWCMRKVIESMNRAAQAVAAPVNVYGADMFHSTISDFRAADGFLPDNEAHRLAIDDLQLAIKHTVASLPGITRNHCAIEYQRRLLCNQTTVIAPGEPNEEWLTVVEQVIARCQDAGITLRKPWGAHMTLARFTDAFGPPESGDLLRATKEIFCPNATLCPRYIGLGAFTCSTDEGFRVDWWHRIKLR